MKYLYKNEINTKKMKEITEKEIILFIRRLQQKKLWYIGIILGIDYLQIYPKSIFLKEELALCYYWIKQPYIGIKLLEEILRFEKLDKKTFLRTISNLRFFKQKLYTTEHSDNPLQHGNRDLNQVILRYESPQSPEEQNFSCVKQAIPKHLESTQLEQYIVRNGVNGLFTFTITCGQRFSLFKKTINSFINNFPNLNLISRWICIDDNSNEEERKLMKEEFYFFEFIFKPKEKKGHAISMQIITDIITTPYIIHIEDDRELLFNSTCARSVNLLKDIISIFKDDSRIGQICFNHNYQETFDDDIRGGILKQTNDGIFYYQHQYHKESKDQIQYSLDIGGQNCSYYPHFTLSPSVIKTSIFQTCKFKQEISFEYNFGLRYVSSGFITCFLPGINFIHIGRLTSEIYDYTKLNAYDMINTEQFTSSIKYLSFVINLDRRSDRMEKIINQTSYLPPYERFSAIDGKNLIYNDVLGFLCEKGDYKMRPGVIGCALSHLTLYHKLLNTPDIEGYLIFEDDIKVNEKFYPSLQRILTILNIKQKRASPAAPAHPDIIFFTTVPKNFNSHVFSQTGIIRKTTILDISKDSNGGTGCYYISKKAATAVFTYLKTFTLNVPIDMLLFQLAPYINMYFIFPPILTQYEENAKSDVQNDFFKPSFLLYEKQTDHGGSDDAKCVDAATHEKYKTLFENGNFLQKIKMKST